MPLWSTLLIQTIQWELSILRATIEDMIENLPETVILFLDEAYSEFVLKDELPRIDPENPKVIRMQTFSYGYGMAAIRIGYAVGPAELIKSFDKIRNHFGVNLLTQRAAIVALEVQEYLESVIKQVKISKAWIVQLSSECGLKAIAHSEIFFCYRLWSRCGLRTNSSKLINR